jgi:hypothetical protein
MGVAPVGEHSIIPCSVGCGRWVRPKRMPDEVGKEIVARLYGPDAVVMINTGRGICTNCRHTTAPYPSKAKAATDEKAAAERAAKAKIAAERLAAAEKARATIEAGRAARAAKRRVHTVRLGQDMVRI